MPGGGGAANFPAMNSLILVSGAGFLAGVMNALAGGGSFVTLPMLILSGLDARAANITSTIALFPGQVTTGLAGRKLVSGAERLSFKALFVISLIGGVLGALLLLATPPSRVTISKERNEAAPTGPSPSR